MTPFNYDRSRCGGDGTVALNPGREIPAPTKDGWIFCILRT